MVIVKPPSQDIPSEIPLKIVKPHGYLKPPLIYMVIVKPPSQDITMKKKTWHQAASLAPWASAWWRADWAAPWAWVEASWWCRPWTRWCSGETVKTKRGRWKNPWENHRKTMGKPWKPMGKPWKTHEELGNSWKNDWKSWQTSNTGWVFSDFDIF